MFLHNADKEFYYVFCTALYCGRACLAGLGRGQVPEGELEREREFINKHLRLSEEMQASTGCSQQHSTVVYRHGAETVR